PRDSWVHIPGFVTSKINSARVDGGPALMVKTIESITGIRVDFWMLTSFGGLRRMVDHIGGLTVTVPYAMHDRYSGANFKAGPIHMRGWQALAFARNRHDTPNGDFSRSQNQGRLFLAALAQLGRQFPANPAVLFTWISAGWRNVSTDLPPGTPSSLDASETRTLSVTYRSGPAPRATRAATRASPVSRQGVSSSPTLTGNEDWKTIAPVRFPSARVSFPR